MSADSSFLYGDNVVFKDGISGAPKGTKAQFLNAVGNDVALVKITKRIPPSQDRNGEPHYINGATVTTRLEHLVKDDGSIEAAATYKPAEPWKPAYEPK